MKELVIGVTDCSKYPAYAQWIAGHENVRTIKLSPTDFSHECLDGVDGVVLTGGEDVHPRFYQKPEYLKLCYPDDINVQRDEMEFTVLEQAGKKNLPVLGICRGLQVANVFFGGTLIPDIPTFIQKDHSKAHGKDRYHEVDVQETSLLRGIVGVNRGTVNSAHHQSADRIAPGLTGSALSTDGVIEGLEWKDPAGKPFLLLVQWHPERMTDQSSPFSKNIRTSFLDAIRASRQ